MQRTTFVIGTRTSDLARRQTQSVVDRLQQLYPNIVFETAPIKTTGDAILDTPLAQIGDKALFTKELENALLRKAIDLAVHSLKDLPTELPEGLLLAAISEREDPRDAFIPHPQKKNTSLGSVPRGGTIATGSLRRKSQLLHVRPDLNIVDIRGNLQTRLEKLKRSKWDGMILAKAGITRLGWTTLNEEILSTDTMLPAVGQGALAIEVRSEDTEVQSLLKPLDDIPTRRATSGERAFLQRLGAGCQVPIGAFGIIKSGILKLDGVVGSLDGKTIVRGSIEGPVAQAEELGDRLGRELIGQGAGKILEDVRTEAASTTPAAQRKPSLKGK